MTEDLPDALHAEVTALCAEGDALAERRDYLLSIVKYEAAFALLPEPRTRWSAATWIMAAILDSHFHNGDFAACREAVQFVFKECPGALQNPFLHLRAGQTYYELGESETAKQWLTTAWMAEGDDLFVGEDQKYWRFIRETLRPPDEEMR